MSLTKGEEPQPDASENVPIACKADAGFADWLSRCGGSVVITTYQAGKVVMVGWNGRQVSVLMRDFPKPMGLAVAGQRLALATRDEVTIFANAPLLAADLFENQKGRYDSLFLPRATYFTGDIAAHDLAFDAAGKLWVVNTRFGCLCTVSDAFNFEPKWKPPFATEIAPGDRYHLNGLAMVDGKPQYVTALGETDTPGGWRDNKATGGIVLDVESGEILFRGLAMPHSPRWHATQLWVLNSGKGELWLTDVKTGRHVVACSLPAYLRGLCFVGSLAFVGLCQIREKHIFGDLPIQQRIGAGKLLCGVALIDLRTGKQTGLLEFTSGCQEIYDVQFLPGVSRPMILNTKHPAFLQASTAPEFSYWMRPSNEIADAGGAPKS